MDGVMMKFNNECQLVWAKSIAGDQQDHIAAIAIGPDNEVLVGGTFSKNTDFDHPGSVQLDVTPYAYSPTDAFVAV